MKFLALQDEEQAGFGARVYASTEAFKGLGIPSAILRVLRVREMKSTGHYVRSHGYTSLKTLYHHDIMLGHVECDGGLRPLKVAVKVRADACLLCIAVTLFAYADLCATDPGIAAYWYNVDKRNITVDEIYGRDTFWRTA